MNKLPGGTPEMRFTYTPPGERPDPEVLPPEQRFIEHVDTTARKGNAVDHIGTYFGGSALNFGIASGLLGTFAAHAEHAGTSLTATLITGAAGAGAAWGFTTKRIPKLQRKERSHGCDQPELQQHLDARYDLWAVGRSKHGRHAVSMRWYGPMQNPAGASGKTELERIARLAEEAGVRTLLVELDLASTCGNNALAPGKLTSMQQWLIKNRGLETKGGSELDIVCEATPAQWRAYAQAIPPASPEDAQTRRLERIGPLQPEHPGLQAVLAYAGIAKTTQAVTLYQHPSPTAETTELITISQQPLKPLESKGELTMLQDELGLGLPPFQETKPTVVTKRRRIGMFLGGVVASAALALGINLGADERMDHLEQVASAQIAQEHNVDSQEANVDPEAARERASSWHQLNAMWYKWEDVRTTLHTQTKDFLKAEGDGSDGSGNPSADMLALSGIVGNIEGDTPRTVWNIETAPGIAESRLQGKWSMGSKSQLSGYRGRGDSQPSIVWSSTNSEFKKPLERIVARSNMLDSHSRWIRVKGEVSLKAETVTRDDGHGYYIPVPVLQGSGFIGAEVNGILATTIRKHDGSYAIEYIGKPQSGILEVRYWLDPFPDTKAERTTPRATEPVSIDASDNMFTYSHADLQAVIQNHHPDLVHMDPMAARDYLHRTLRYRLAPMPSKSGKKINSWPTYLDRLFTEGNANCGYATTALILQNLAQGKADPNAVLGYSHKSDLNAVVGYSNSKNPFSLDTLEAHMWAVDHQGREYDPTPPAPLTAKEPAPAPPPFPTWPLHALGLSATALGVYGAYRQRHHIQRGARWATNTAQERTFKLATPLLQSTLAAAEHAIWSPPGAIFDADTAKKVRPALNGREAYAALQRPHLHSQAMLEHMQQQPATTRLMRAVVRAARYSHQRASKMR